MRNLLLAISAMLFLSGCDLYYIAKADMGYHRWQVGDCVQKEGKKVVEPWEKEEATVYRILEIGKKSYRVRVYQKIDGEYKMERYFRNDLSIVERISAFDMTHPFMYVDHNVFKTQCPVELNN